MNRLGTVSVLLLMCVVLPMQALAQDGGIRVGDSVGEAKLVGVPGVFHTPWDATPDPTASFIYFTATSASTNEPGVFRVPANGGEVKSVALGEPFVAPMGVGIGTNGQKLFVTDLKADAIFIVPIDGGITRSLQGTKGTAPRVPEVVNQGGIDRIYYSGIDPVDGRPVVFKIAAVGGTPSVVAKGAPLVDPSGVAVAADGTVYVVDRAASGEGLGSVFRVAGDEVEAIAEGIRTGDHPVGIALTLDESLLLVSSLNLHRDSAQVLLIDLSTLATDIFNKGIKQNQDPAGLHRAHGRNQFAWADATAGVYQIGSNPPPRGD